MSMGPLIPSGVKRPYSFLKGSEAMGGHTLTSPPARPSGGCCQLVGQPCPSRFPPSCWSSPCQWTLQMCQGWRSREVGTCSRLLGPSWDMHSGLTLGGTFAFISCWFCWGLIPSIWVFQGGLGDIYIYIIFFRCCCCFVSKRTTTCVGAREG